MSIFGLSQILQWEICYTISMKIFIYLIFIFILITTSSWSRCCGMTAFDASYSIPPTYNEELVKDTIRKEFTGKHKMVDGGLILKTPKDPGNVLACPLSVKSSIEIKTITIFSFNDLNEGNFIVKVNVLKDLPLEYIEYGFRIKLKLTDSCKGGVVIAIGEGFDGKLYFNKNMIWGSY